MSTLPKPKFSISARHLGPILTLNGELTKHAQNLIFARNGTGKSFLSRALRYLDLKSQGKDIADASHNLVSDESVDGKGAFSFSRGQTLGALQLDKNDGETTGSVTDTIFHVFSEDFVHEELREREYEIDGKIENQIAVDSDNIKLKGLEETLEMAVVSEETATLALSEKYETEKVQELNEKAGVNKQLKDYKALSFEGLLERFAEKPNSLDRSFADILKDLDSLKAIPAEPVYPEPLSLFHNNDINIGELESLLQKVTSPSSVSDDIKEKIDTHHSFYESGTKLVREDHRSTCPFCEQGITSPSPKAIIDAYIAYFEDEEEKHKAELRDFFRRLNQKETELGDTETQLARQKSRYDALKHFVPSQKDTELADGEAHFSTGRAVITNIKKAIQEKAEVLSTVKIIPEGDLFTSISEINETIEANNMKALELKKSVEKSDEERRELQREACKVFDHAFTIASWEDIKELRALREDVKNKQSQLSELEKSSPSKDARVRVAETFELLLREFFAHKYVFDKDTFVLRRGAHEMVRGPHRTLSDGEKTAIAFCYFIACVHRKVASNSDYRNLFLVFDDPVTSMSYDFVFAIAQTLKNLGVSDKGEVSINPSKIDGKKCLRPELLILTHSSYFFNVSRTNRVVKEDATFSLSADGNTHILSPLRSYVAPFEQQLAHVLSVANGSINPDHITGNAIRSVLEAVGRFCRPDKSQSLELFIAHLAGEEGFSIKSVLINSLCHGTYYDESPSSEDLKLACNEAIAVVEKFAKGQIEIIQKNL